MTRPIELSKQVVASGDRLSDAQHGLLLDALQLGARITEQPTRFRQALALVARRLESDVASCSNTRSVSCGWKRRELLGQRRSVGIEFR